MINKLILGTVQLGLDYGINNKLGKPSLEKAFEILDVAFEKGVKTLDTAEAYGNSHEVIGKFQKLNPEKKFKIITKLKANTFLTKDSFMSHLTKNCEKLATSQLHGYMFHDYKSFKNKIELYEEVLKAKDSKLIKKAGISLYHNEEIEDIIENFQGFDFIQVPFNLLDNALQRKSTLIKAKEKGVEIHTRSTFLQGLFFKNSNDLPPKLNPIKPYLETVESIKNKANIATGTLALQYALQKEYIDHVLIGVESANQLSKNITICETRNKIPHDSIDSINVKEKKLLNPSHWA